MSAISAISTSTHSNEFQTDEQSQILINQISSIQAIKVLSRLIKAVQKHRGASMACIAGEKKFLPLVKSLEEHIQKLFRLLATIEHNQHFLNIERLDFIISDWQAIKQGWQQDSVIHNYQFHCHLIDALSRLSQQWIKQYILQPSNHDNQSIEEINTVFFKTPEQIELLAKLRGLATHVAFSGVCDTDYHMQINFLQKKITDDYPQLFQQLNKLKGPLAKISIIHSIPAQQHKLQFLLDFIKTTIIETPNINTEGSKIFHLTTKIIDFYWTVVEQGTQAIENEILEQHLN